MIKGTKITELEVRLEEYADDPLIIALIQTALAQLRVTVGRPTKYTGDAQERHREASKRYRDKKRLKAAIEHFKSDEGRRERRATGRKPRKRR